MLFRNGEAVAVDELNNDFRFELFPNPFSAGFNATYQLEQTTFVQIELLDILGGHISKLISEQQTSGAYSFNWEKENIDAGVYTLRVQVGEEVKT